MTQNDPKWNSLINPKMTQKWPKNDPKMTKNDQKMTKNEQKMNKKWTKNEQKMKKWPKNDLKMTQNDRQNHFSKNLTTFLQNLGIGSTSTLGSKIENFENSCREISLKTQNMGVHVCPGCTLFQKYRQLYVHGRGKEFRVKKKNSYDHGSFSMI